MSLYEPADGLLGTHVTWHDVEMEMQRVLGTNARFGENRKIRDIGDMKVKKRFCEALGNTTF